MCIGSCGTERKSGAQTLNVNNRERNRDGRNGHADRRAAGFDLRATLSRHVFLYLASLPAYVVPTLLLLSAGTVNGLGPDPLAMTVAHAQAMEAIGMMIARGVVGLLVCLDKQLSV